MEPQFVLTSDLEKQVPRKQSPPNPNPRASPIDIIHLLMSRAMILIAHVSLQRAARSGSSIPLNIHPIGSSSTPLKHQGSTEDEGQKIAQTNLRVIAIKPSPAPVTTLT